MAQKVLIVVDMQNDFIDGALGSKEAASIVDHVAEKIREAEEHQDTIVFTQDTHDANYLSTEEGKNLPIPHCIRNTKGWEISDRLPLPKEYTIFHKETFGSSALSEFIAKLARTKEDYVFEVIGLCTDICVLSNAVVVKTFFPNAHIVVDAACCAGVTPQSHDTALDAMKAIQIEIIHQGKEPWRNST